MGGRIREREREEEGGGRIRERERMDRKED